MSNSADVATPLKTHIPTTKQPSDGSSDSSPPAKASPNDAKVKSTYDASQFPMAMTPNDPGWNDLAGIKGGPRMNATFVTLARNSDVWEIAKSIRQVEDRFKRRYNYDWVFLNDKPFDDLFKTVTTSLVSGKTHYGLIPKEHWSFPEWIDQDKAAKVREDMKERKIIYGDSVSYRHMCRFESGFFFRQELMLNYEYYWRVEPSVELYCDVHYDPFRFMHENKKKYSFVLSLYEYHETIPTLWDSVKKFMKNHPEHIASNNMMSFLSDDGGETYNKCHFVSCPCSYIPSAHFTNVVLVVQLRGRQSQLAQVQGIHRLFRKPGPRRRLLLRALGRRTRALDRGGVDAPEGRDPLLQRHCLLPCAIYPLPDGSEDADGP